jgi:hypothetical protein
MIEASPMLVEWPWRVPQLKANIDGLFQRRLALGKPRQCAEGLLEAHDRLVESRTAGRLDATFARVGSGLVPELATKGMVGQLLDVLGQAIGIELLDRLHDPGVKAASSIRQHTAVGHLVGERMLERVLELREETRLIA